MEGQGQILSDLSWTTQADLTLNLKNPAGATVATSRSTTGSTSVSYLAPGAGGYSIQVVNNSTTLDAPTLTATSRTPRTHFANVKVQLKDNAGAVVAEDASGARPKTITATVPAGRYSWVTTALSGTGTATLTGTYPSRPLRQVIGYDANDHATSIDDGTTRTEETLSPGGRVLRRRISDSATGEVQQDVLYGYDGPGDSPAYSRLAAGGPLTAYLRGASGLLAVYTGTAAAYPITNGHGDIVGTTDAGGAFTANPTTDEYGVSSSPPQYGWLGDHQRMATGGNLGLIRMGVRLYDPALGRFLQVDPVEGGSANDYDYVGGDPVNDSDLDGRHRRRRSRARTLCPCPYLVTEWHALAPPFASGTGFLNLRVEAFGRKIGLFVWNFNLFPIRVDATLGRQSRAAIVAPGGWHQFQFDAVLGSKYLAATLSASFVFTPWFAHPYKGPYGIPLVVGQYAYGHTYWKCCK